MGTHPGPPLDEGAVSGHGMAGRDGQWNRDRAGGGLGGGRGRGGALGGRDLSLAGIAAEGEKVAGWPCRGSFSMRAYHGPRIPAYLPMKWKVK
jgi:hypothetical protein